MLCFFKINMYKNIGNIIILKIMFFSHKTFGWVNKVYTRMCHMKTLNILRLSFESLSYKNYVDVWIVVL